MWFDHVEVNASYYATPRVEAVTKWVEATPPSFLFDVRLHRAFSVNPEKIVEEGRLLGYLLEGLEPLIRVKKLGAFLLVLSPFFSPERHQLTELDRLVEMLRPHALAVELRHTGWIEGKVRESTMTYFRDRGVTLVSVDMPRLADVSLMPPIYEVTNPGLAYLRLHGRNPKYLKAKSAAQRHTYLYSETELAELAATIRDLSTKVAELRVVANNHSGDFAPKTALRLKELLGQF
jgi:uncharacterized protein YecE (DUF72 family)